MNTQSTSPSSYRCVLAIGLCGALGIAAPSRADVISDWNRAGLEAGTRSVQQPDSRLGTLAVLNIAMFEALNFVSGRYRSPFLVHHDGFSNISADAAAAAAAHQVLARAYPEQKPRFDRLLGAALDELPADGARANGVVAGRSVANAVQAALAVPAPRPPAKREGNAR